MRMSRQFAMPNSETFQIDPIYGFVKKYLNGVSIDPFSRNSRLATYRNDLNSLTCAEFHMDAEEFCNYCQNIGVVADVGLFDPPYSPRQISECYQSVGKKATAKDTQNAALYKRVRDAMNPLIKSGGIVLSFGWHSNGMGKNRGYELIDLLIVAHGGAHNDTICIAERKL